MADQPKFSLRALLAFTTAVAAGASLLSAPQDWKPDWRVGALAFIVMAAVPASAIVGIMFGGRYGRAFSIGVLVPSIWTVVLLCMVTQGERMIVVGRGESFTAGREFFVVFARNACHDVGALTICSLAVGLICVAVCWCISGPNT